jgi:hypothetical protein
MRKFVCYSIIYMSIFYVNFFEIGKMYFEPLQIWTRLKIQVKLKEVLRIPGCATWQPLPPLPCHAPHNVVSLTAPTAGYAIERLLRRWMPHATEASSHVYLTPFHSYRRQILALFKQAPSVFFGCFPTRANSNPPPSYHSREPKGFTTHIGDLLSTPGRRSAAPHRGLGWSTAASLASGDGHLHMCLPSFYWFSK